MLSEQVNIVCRKYSKKTGCAYEKCPIYTVCKLKGISLKKESWQENYKFYCREMNKAAKKAIKNETAPE